MQNWTVTEWTAFFVALTAAVGAIGASIANTVIAIRTGRKIDEVKQATDQQSKVLDYQTRQMAGPEAVQKSKE